MFIQLKLRKLITMSATNPHLEYNGTEFFPVDAIKATSGHNQYADTNYDRLSFTKDNHSAKFGFILLIISNTRNVQGYAEHVGVQDPCDDDQEQSLEHSHQDSNGLGQHVATPDQISRATVIILKELGLLLHCCFSRSRGG